MAFSKGSKLDLSNELKYFSQTVTEFLLSLTENIKGETFLTF